jgi:hypothetical protein
MFEPLKDERAYLVLGRESIGDSRRVVGSSLTVLETEANEAWGHRVKAAG